MVSDINYTQVSFSDGSSSVFAYCQKAIHARFGVQLKKVRRGISVDQSQAVHKDGKVSILGQTFAISRRLKSTWLILLLLMASSSAMSQLAVADTFYTCKTRPVTLSLMQNDHYFNSTATISNFQSLSSGSLALNGKSVILTYATPDTVTFQYRIFDPVLSTYSSYVTVKAVGKQAINMAGSYSDGSNITTTGCRVLTRGDTTWEPTTKAIIQSNNSITLLPGAEIKSGAVLELKIKQQ